MGCPRRIRRLTPCRIPCLMPRLPDDFDDDDDRFDPDHPLADQPALAAVARFARMLETIPWFSRVGDRLDADDRTAAEDYLSALGFPGAAVVPVGDWYEAADCAEALDMHSLSWEEEEHLRAVAHETALEITDEEALDVALSHVAHQAASLVGPAAVLSMRVGGLDDEALARAAAGHAVQACHQAALVLAAGLGAEHPFALKFRLYERGRWPVSITGESFNLF